MSAVRVGSAVLDPEGDIGEVVGRTPSGRIVVEYGDGDISWHPRQLVTATPAQTAATKKKKYPKATSGKISKGIAQRMRDGTLGQTSTKKKSESTAKKKAAASKAKSKAESEARAAERERKKREREAERERKRRERELARQQRERERQARQKARGVRAAEKYKIKDPEFEQEVKRDASGQFSKTETAKSFTTNGGRVGVGDWVATEDGSRRGRVMGRTKDGRVVIVSDDGKQTSHDRFALSRENRRDTGQFKAGGTTWEEAVRTKMSSPEFLYAVQHEFETSKREGRNPVFHLGPHLQSTMKALRDAKHSVFTDAEGRVYMMWKGRKVRLKGYTRTEDDR